MPDTEGTRGMRKILVMLLMAAMLLSGCVKVDCKLDLKTPTAVFESAAPTPSPSPEATQEETPETSPSPSPSPSPKPKSTDGWFLRFLKWVSSYQPPSLDLDSEVNSSNETSSTTKNDNK
jgi:hypothetical protein